MSMDYQGVTDILRLFCACESNSGRRTFRSVCLSQLADSVLTRARRTLFEYKDDFLKDGHLRVAPTAELLLAADGSLSLI